MQKYLYSFIVALILMTRPAVSGPIDFSGSNTTWDYSRDAKEIALTRANDPYLYVYNVLDGKQKLKLNTGINDLTSVAISGDGSTIAFSNGINSKIYNIEKKKYVYQSSFPSGDVEIYFVNDSSIVHVNYRTTSPNGYVWDAIDGKTGNLLFHIVRSY